MAIRKFKVEIVRTDEYTIEIDDAIIGTPEWIEEFEKSFHPISDLEDVVKDLAYHQIRHGDDRFIEGYGIIKRNGQIPFEMGDTARPPVAEDGLNIITDVEDEDYSYDVKEVTT